MNAQKKRQILRVGLTIITWVLLGALLVVLLKSCVGGPPINYG